MFRTELGILAHQVGADEGFGRRRGGGLKAWLQWLGNHLGGEQLAEFDLEFLRAGDPECLERVRCRPIAVRRARRWYGRRRANRSEPAVRSAPRSPVRERVGRGPGGFFVPSEVGELG